MGRSQKPDHDAAKASLAGRLRQEGARVIDPDERVPDWMAVLGDLVFAVVHKQGKLTEPSIRAKYPHYDGVLIWKDDFDAWRIHRERQGFRFIRSARKAPDLLAYRDGHWIAVEALRKPSNGTGAHEAKGKRINYGAWDAVMVDFF